MATCQSILFRFFLFPNGDAFSSTALATVCFAPLHTPYIADLNSHRTEKVTS